MIDPRRLRHSGCALGCVLNEEMAEDVRWIQSYVLDEGDGAVGTVCIYEATSQAAIREHAPRAGLPADEIVRIAETAVVRPDPVAAD
jgi:Protein of unknown function (DUF4242)